MRACACADVRMRVRGCACAHARARARVGGVRGSSLALVLVIPLRMSTS